jgi:3-oxoacid CoA-transferase subunit A
VKAWKGDEAGNLVFKGTARNFNPCMAGAAKSPLQLKNYAGSLDPNEIHIPGILVNRIFQGEIRETN